MSKADYSKTQIYKLVCKDLPNDPTCIYTGHTTNWKQRKSEHKSRSKMEPTTQYYNYPIYKTIREHGGWDNWDMILIEDFPCESKRHAEAKEQEWIIKIKSEMNTRRACCTKEIKQSLDYKTEINKRQNIRYHNLPPEEKEKLSIQKKEYAETHKEAIQQHKKIYREDHKEDIKKWRDEHREEQQAKSREKYKNSTPEQKEKKAMQRKEREAKKRAEKLAEKELQQQP